MKSGAPPDKFGVLYRIIAYSIVSQAELILKVITLWFLVLSQFFRDSMGPFKVYIKTLRENILQLEGVVCINCSPTEVSGRDPETPGEAGGGVV